jgi:two-component system, OmpR family, phosphate regulon response regulator OmpR
MSLSGKQILIVDDDPKLRDLVRRYLAENHFEVSVAQDSISMNRLIQRQAFDVLILDLMMPGEDGLSILRRLRGAGDKTPILMLTAKGDDIDRIIGLEMGADDYLPKPFNPRELLARINAILRRAPVNQPGAPLTEGQTVAVKFGELMLDLNTRILSKAGEPVPLTTGEFSVLKILAQHAKQPISRDKLMVLARGREYGAFDRSLDVQISRLRKLIEVDPQNPRYLQTVWGVGYVLIPD